MPTASLKRIIARLVAVLVAVAYGSLLALAAGVASPAACLPCGLCAGLAVLGAMMAFDGE